MSILGIQSRMLGLVRPITSAIPTNNLANKFHRFLPQEGICTPPLQRPFPRNFDGKLINPIASHFSATRAFSTTFVQQQSSGDGKPSIDFVSERRLALETFWSAIRSQLKFDDGCSNDSLTLKQIHYCLHSLANACKIQSVNELKCPDSDLTSLPHEIGLFTGLRSLALNNNKITRLPREIGKLTELQELYLSCNNLDMLPHNISECAELKVLDLSHNRLQHLPYGIMHLRKLLYLDLSHNKLTNLLCLLGNINFNSCSEIPVIIHHNPLIAFLNDDLSEFVSEKPLSSLAIAQKYRMCADYSAKSPLARLAQAIHCGAEDTVLYNRFKNLSGEMQQRINTQSMLLQKANSGNMFSPLFSGESLFVDRAIFTRAVIAAMHEKLTTLSSEQRDRLDHWRIWQLAEQSQRTNSEGQHPILLIDALAKVI